MIKANISGGVYDCVLVFILSSRHISCEAKAGVVKAKIVSNLKSIMKVPFFFLICGLYVQSISGSMDACQDGFWNCKDNKATLNAVRSVKNIFKNLYIYFEKPN